MGCEFKAQITGRNEVLAKVIFLHLSVIHSVHRGGSGMETPTPPGRGPPPGPDPSWHVDPLRDQTPLAWRDPPGMENPPLEADSGIRSTIGRYASYWNAFLFY